MRPTDDDAGTVPADQQMRMFIGGVRASADISETEASTLARATLHHLGEHVSGDEAQELSGALPGDLADEVTASAGRSGRPDTSAFLEAVAAHVHASGTETGETVRRVHAVLSTVRAWTPGDQFESTLAGLSPDLAVLFA